MSARREDGIEFSFKGKLRDFLILISLLGVGGNLLWCWQHGSEIKDLREKLNPSNKAIQQQSLPQKLFATKTTNERKQTNGNSGSDFGR